ncbi:MAG: MBL fold metallo-hydrolase [Flavobacteriales bacterium]|nr:MBL fold metallo-hydrolase [Flavobacteriales bacterium]
MVVTLIITLVISAGTFIFLKTERFGAHPSGQRLEKIKQSPNYEKGSFKNLHQTPMLTEGASYGGVLYEYFFASKPIEPTKDLPSVKTDLHAIRADENVLIWMRHSSYFMQIDGKRILVDPVMSGYASPVSFTTRAYKGTDIYTPDDIPEIDFLFLSHDHWDHMDFNTLKALEPKIKQIITGLGNGAHLERWGFQAEVISEGDWYQNFEFEDGIKISVTPSRHFSGRGLTSAKTLWASFVLQTPSTSIYIGGDSGYDTHFKEIGKKYGPFDLAILENGQYNKNWKHIHMLPGEQFDAANDLNAQAIFPVHSGKFTLANHNWDEPLSKIMELAADQGKLVITPKIGEVVHLKDSTQLFEQWWETAK